MWTVQYLSCSARKCDTWVLFVFSFKARAKLKAPGVSHNSPGDSRGAGKVKESTEGAEDAEETPKCPLGNFRGSAVLSGQHNAGFKGFSSLVSRF